MNIEITDEQRKTLALIETLQELNLPKNQLEASLISLLQWIYKDNEIRIINYLESMDELRNVLSN